MRKILYISGTRAEYGLMKYTLFKIQHHPKLKLEIIATGMHLMKEFGYTVKEIEKNGFKIHRIGATYQRDDKASVCDFISKFISGLVKKVREIHPDIILALGDRPEVLCSAIVGTYLTIPVAHVHGGDISGHVDNLVRHAITKLAHIHFVATKKSAERLIKMGEEPWRVFVVGAPGLDVIQNEKLIESEEIAKKYNLDTSKPILLVLQHPVLYEIKSCTQHMRNIMEVIKELKYQTIVICPNADPGGRKMIKVIEKYRKYSFIKIYKHIPHKEFLSLMRIVSVMIGNSSSGIIEAPSFHIPVVNIGTRQMGRERTGNTIDVGYGKTEIKAAIKKALFDKKFRNKVKRCKNSYGDGKASEKIINILSKIKIDRELLEKRLL